MSTSLRITPARPDDLERYLDLLEDLADWLAARRIDQWPRGGFRRSSAYYGDSIDQGEVQLAFVGDELVGTLRVLLREPIVWPEIVEDDAVYVYNLGIKRAWAHHGFGGRLLQWADEYAASLGRRFVRLDCVSGNAFLRRYYTQAGFLDRGAIDAAFPPPVGTLALRRYEKPVPLQ